jgi:SAM-dependent methyltransferase
MSLDEMDLPGASLDFVIACQVIEHTHSPLRVFERVYRTLRPGGRLLLVVPDTLLTFDAPREATSLDHLREDYANWSPEKDTLHYVEFYSKAFVTPIDELYDRVRTAIATRHDIHFHTWTYESFQDTVEYSRQEISPWRHVLVAPLIETRS